MTSLSAIPRAGQLECICEPGTLNDEAVDRRGTALLATGFAFSVLAQVLTLSILPLAGLSLAPSQALVPLPYAAFYAGAALASLPASLLLDSFGRRAAFSLGASLGAAGGLVLVWALVTLHFGALVLGAFWLGIAGGFSLFYRHVAVPVGGKRAGALLLVFGAASLASVAAPSISGLAEALALSEVFAGTAAAAALAHIASLGATAALPYHNRRAVTAESPERGSWRAILPPSLIGAVGWFAMTALMGTIPLAVIGCAPSDAVVGAIAWHVMAMYAPSMGLAVFPQAAHPVPLAAGGCLLLASGVLAFMASSTAEGFSASAALVGIGWSLIILGTTLWIHRDGPVSRWALGLHDSALLSGAILGALVANGLP